MYVAGPIPSTSINCSRLANGPALLAEVDDPPRGQLVEPGDVPQQGDAGRVEVDADEVDATRDDRLERLLELLGVDVVLIEPDADVLRLDLHQLGQRVLKPRPIEIPLPQRRVELGQLVAADLAGGVDAGAGLVDDDIGELGEQGVGGVRPGRRRRRGGPDGCRPRDPRSRGLGLPLAVRFPGAEAGRRRAAAGAAACGRSRRPASAGRPAMRPRCGSPAPPGVGHGRRSRPVPRPARRAALRPVVGDGLGRAGGRGSGFGAGIRARPAGLRLPVVRHGEVGDGRGRLARRRVGRLGARRRRRRSASIVAVPSAAVGRLSGPDSASRRLRLVGPRGSRRRSGAASPPGSRRGPADAARRPGSASCSAPSRDPSAASGAPASGASWRLLGAGRTAGRRGSWPGG